METQTTDQRAQEQLAYLERDFILESMVWSPLKARVERTGGRDAQLNTLCDQSMSRIDHILDQSNVVRGMTGAEGES